MSDPSGQYRPLFATLELTTTRMTQALAQIALLHADLAMNVHRFLPAKAAP